MHAETYIREIRTETVNEKGLEVLLKIQEIFNEWGKTRGAVLSVSGIVAMCLCCWGLEAATCTYERLFPPPIPPNGLPMQVYRIVQHVLSVVAFSLLTWCIHTLFFYLFLEPKKEGFQKELEGLLNESPGFLRAIKRVDLDLYQKIVNFLPACSEHFAT